MYIETKKEKMVEWWIKSFELFVKFGLSKDTLKKLAKSKEIRLRNGVTNLLNFSAEKNIPFVIISAS
jgi:2-hydroxy-3-keto-5-methylthiopentenyl-1-phosphate phosphatase